MGKLKKFIKDWMLVLAMMTGAGAYLAYRALPVLHPAGPVLLGVCRTLQPWLLFSMLFLSFCRIRPSDMKLQKWQVWLLMVQGGLFVLLSLLIVWALGAEGAFAASVRASRIPIESAMLCFICPTATACAVVTDRLGGSMAGVVSYTVLINILVAVLVPLMVPLVYPLGRLTFGAAFLKILMKVFPLLIMPCLAAWAVRYLTPRLHAWLQRYTHIAFYIWASSLTLAILMSTRAIVHNDGDPMLLVWIALASMVCCAFQFGVGKLIGARYGHRITAGQAMGQKNTVFAIWMGYTFLDPVTSVVGGLYSIWHNLFNTWQLRHAGRPALKEL